MQFFFYFNPGQKQPVGFLLIQSETDLESTLEDGSVVKLMHHARVVLSENLLAHAF